MRQVGELVHMQCSIMFSAPYLQLVERLLPVMPHPSLDQFFFWNSGMSLSPILGSPANKGRFRSGGSRDQARSQGYWTTERHRLSGGISRPDGREWRFDEEQDHLHPGIRTRDGEAYVIQPKSSLTVAAWGLRYALPVLAWSRSHALHAGRGDRPISEASARSPTPATSPPPGSCGHLHRASSRRRASPSSPDT